MNDGIILLQISVSDLNIENLRTDSKSKFLLCNFQKNFDNSSFVMCVYKCNFLNIFLKIIQDIQNSVYRHIT